MAQQPTAKLRHLILVLGDQLSLDSSAFDRFNANEDAVLMMEVAEEATYVPQHKLRLALFFSAMRHFRLALQDHGYPIYYVELEDQENLGSFEKELGRWIHQLRPDKVIVCQPGDYRVMEALRGAVARELCELEIRPDRHFFCTMNEFRSHAEGRKALVMEHFYRHVRRRHEVLMTPDGPVGGQWNLDADNRETFGRRGPGQIKPPLSFAPDKVTKGVLKMVQRRFADSPGSLNQFDYPVSREQARAALSDFVEHRLAGFGTYEDAMAKGYPYLYHSRLSRVLNLHLLDPKEAVAAALGAYECKQAPLNSVEGFVRQILGWREFIRGVYWLKMPSYADLNALDADLPMPAFMWTGETEMSCLQECVGQLVNHAYAHHIQRLMVLGLYALLLGVRPYEVHRWHMSMYVDAIDWVSLPNVLGMSQYGDGGIVGSKPYSASGSYINRMSDYCAGCRYDPKQATGDNACPITTLYWDFLARNRPRILHNRRMGFQLSSLDRKTAREVRSIRKQADRLKSEMTAEIWG
jgi:deoxyribodipyrimidine photolyase-related protein